VIGPQINVDEWPLEPESFETGDGACQLGGGFGPVSGQAPEAGKLAERIEPEINGEAIGRLFPASG
jgi:hypothetical protein